MGRSMPAILSSTSWAENRLVIRSEYPCQNPATRQWSSAIVIQTLWLQPAAGTPWEPQLVIETTREGVFGGESVTNRTIYNRGYR